jgi:rhodanese-related sulfurtransferase
MTSIEVGRAWGWSAGPFNLCRLSLTVHDASTAGVTIQGEFEVVQNIRVSAAELVARANEAVSTLTVAQARDLHGRDDVAFIDLRDIRELTRTGRIAGASHVPRGMLEFWIDPESPYHKALFAEDKTFVFYCATGWRSALAAKCAQDMGLHPVAHLDGGITAWLEAGGPIDSPKD